MKGVRLLMLLGSLLAIQPAMADVVTPAWCEYWIDNDFEARTSVAIVDSCWAGEIDFSHYPAGVHTLGIRVSDSKGRWSTPLTRHVVRLTRSLQGNTACKYEYWIDSNVEHRVTGELTDGSAAFEADLSHVVPGVHTLTLRTVDAAGLYSTPTVHFFVRSNRSFEGNTACRYEYWIDSDVEHRVTGELTDGSDAFEADLSHVVPGVHTLTLRTVDALGLYSTPVVHFFVRSNRSFEGNTPCRYRYWIDGEIESAVEGELGNDGIVNLDLDLSHLCRGVHTLTFMVSDKLGNESVPYTKFFVVPAPSLVGNEMVAYEYWFNKGERRRVAVEAANPLVLSDVEIEIKDITPRTIPCDYTLDMSNQTVNFNEEVFFGMQGVDAVGNRSMAVLSDTFVVPISIPLQFTELISDITEIMPTPQAHEIKAFMISANASDSLRWRVSNGCMLDVFSANGERIALEEEAVTDEYVSYRMQTTTSNTYALLYDVPIVMNEVSVTCTILLPSHVQEVEAGVKIGTSKGRLSITLPNEQSLQVVNTIGQVLIHEQATNGTHHYRLPSGVYLVKLEEEVHKVLVP